MTHEQRSQLENLIRSGNAPARTQTKARILLLTDRNSGPVRKDAEIAEAVMVSVATVGRTHRTLISKGTDVALYDRPRQGGVPKITGDIEAKEARRIANKIEWHYTLKHGTWLNMAKIELSALSRQCLATHTRCSYAGTKYRCPGT